MDNKRPTGRKKNISGHGKTSDIHGSGLNTGPVGNGRTDSFNPSTHKIEETGRRSSGRGVKRSGGVLPLAAIIALLLFGGNSLFGGDSQEVTYQATPAPTVQATKPPVSTPHTVSTPQIDYGIQPSHSSGYSFSSGPASVTNTDTVTIDESVPAGTRDKYTRIYGNKKDEVTIMVYMCGTDLESRSSMATRDLVEMTKAPLSDKVHVLAYTGGCTRWNNSVVSSSRNQIYEVKNGGLERLVADAGTASMTDPDTLSSFIQWCVKRYPANRNELILWDHGGGSVSGFGYDEKYPRSVSMSLAGIEKALKDSGVVFDFIGFDACLMATLENGLMLDRYADYMIASEETEPGIGWYYTNWLSRLSANPSMPTVEIGKYIVDDFIQTCATQTRGQSATLSVVDLAELAHSVPSALKDFSKALSGQIKNKQYQQISNARNNTREFARSTYIDQIDLVHFTKNIGSSEGTELARALQRAVKYNRTSSNMSDAYGLSIYFPYRKANKLDSACNTYEAIGMEESYTECIRAFASLEVSGQAASGVGGYSIPSILSGGYTSSTSGEYDLISELIGSFLTGNYSNMPGYSPYNTGFMSGRALSVEETSQYISENSFDASALIWTRNARGQEVISLPDEQWDLITGLEYNAYLDNGRGFIDLGLDTVYDFDEEGNLLAPQENTWLAINEQPVAYYHEYTVGEGDDAIISGYVPALLNGERVELLIVFDPEHPYGTITGLRYVYTDGETETVAKSVPSLNYHDDVDSAWVQEEAKPFWKVGDTIQFIADFYSYEGEYQNSFPFGDPVTVRDDMVISDIYLDSSTRQSYRFTDLYQQHYWTPALYS